VRAQKRRGDFKVSATKTIPKQDLRSSRTFAVRNSHLAYAVACLGIEKNGHVAHRKCPLGPKAGGFQVRTMLHKRWRSGAAIKANPPRGGGAKPMALLLSTEQGAGLPNDGGVITSSGEPHPLAEKGVGRSGAYMRGSIALRKRIATHPKMIAVVAAPVAGCPALLMTFFWGLVGASRASAASTTYSVKDLGTLGSPGILEQKSVRGRGACS
jgi:hypothetical protein